MKKRDVVEVLVIATVTGAAYLARDQLPARLNCGWGLLLASVTLLVQGLGRDLWLLHVQRSRPASASKQVIACVCLESTLGLTGVVAGGALSFFFRDLHLDMTPARWIGCLSGILVFGFVTKDWVVQWSPLAVRRVRDHEGVFVRFR